MAELGLGTAQLGSAYGISNVHGAPRPEVARKIVTAALDAGVRVFDTAPAYGSEEALGASIEGLAVDLRVVTKTLPVDGRDVTTAGVVEEFETSLRRLRLPGVSALLVHHGTDLTGPAGPELAGAMVELKARGLVEKVGFSVYDPGELEAAATVFSPDIVQLPLNVLDQRFLRNRAIENLADGGVEVHVRSAFLQGVLLMDPADLPASVLAARPAVAAFVAACHEQGVAPLVAALGFCLSAPGVDVVVVGAAAAAEVAEVAAAARSEVSIDLAGLAALDSNVIDPRRWH